MNKTIVREQIDRFYKKEEQLMGDLPPVIWSSNRIRAELIKVSRDMFSELIRIEIKGQIKKEAIKAIRKNGFEIESITTRRSTLIIFIKEQEQNK